VALHFCALQFRILGLLIGIATLALGVTPAHAQFSGPPQPGILSNNPEAAFSDTSVIQTSWLAADEQVVAQPNLTPVSSYDDNLDYCCPTHNWYVMLSAGAQSRNTVHEIGNPATFLTFDDGFAINAALGHQFALFRTEFEYSLFNNQVETAGAGIPNVGNFVGDAVGNVSIKAYTLNAYRDFELNNSCWKLYVGAGIGLMQSEINSLYPDFFPTLGATTGGVNSTSNYKLCYQFRAGLSYEFSDRTDLFGGYRFFDAGPLTFAGEPFGVFHPDGATYHNIEFGIRIRF
jgi:opacity protein-like surface antigen